MQNIILVVDDNPELVDGVKLTLEMEDFQVLTATNGQEALEILERSTPDLILTDIMMPGMDGYDFHAEVTKNEAWVHIPFIFLTAKTDKTDIRHGKELGADDYITKPFDPEDVVAAIRGRLKRMSELTGRPAKGDVVGQIKYLWRSKLGPVPVPAVSFLALAAIIILTAMPVWFLRQPDLGRFDLPLREGVGEMVVVPGGEFIRGGSEAGMLGEQKMMLPAYQIDKFEVTNMQYKTFVEDTGYPAPWGSYPANQPDYPVTNVSWHDGQAYCNWAGKRLPTEAEWEKAARGETGQIFPWGSTMKADVANTVESNNGGPIRVGSFEGSPSPYGAFDLGGNVWEWVDDWYDSGQGAKVIRGGAWNAAATWANAASRNQAQPTQKTNNIGFRCAR